MGEAKNIYFTCLKSLSSSATKAYQDLAVREQRSVKIMDPTQNSFGMCGSEFTVIPEATLPEETSKSFYNGRNRCQGGIRLEVSLLSSGSVLENHGVASPG